MGGTINHSHGLNLSPVRRARPRVTRVEVVPLECFSVAGISKK